MILFEQHLTGGDRNFGYLLGDSESGSAALIDPSYNPDLLVERAKAQNLTVHWVLNTHDHHDHINGNDRVLELCPKAKLLASPTDGQTIDLGALSLKALHTPGHTPEHMVFYQPDFQLAMTGDHLFVGKIGGTGSDEAAKQQYESLKRLKQELPETATIWPGHDVGVRPSSTIQLEWECNPFLLCSSFEAFLNLKNNWTQYKEQHGLL